MNKEIFNPLFNNIENTVTASETENKLEEINLVAVASSDSVDYKRPHSPISNEAMIEVICGPYGQPEFKAWAHLRDRIVIPHKN